MAILQWEVSIRKRRWSTSFRPDPERIVVEFENKSPFCHLHKGQKSLGIVRKMNSIEMWKKIFERFLNKKVKKTAPRNGKWKEFNKQAVLVSEGHYQHDLKHGQWKQYYETGELLIEETYDNGTLHGHYAAYHINGKRMSEGQYKRGRREGYFQVFDEQGKQLKRMLFVNNNMVEEVDSSRVPGGNRSTVLTVPLKRR